MLADLALIPHMVFRKEPVSWVLRISVTIIMVVVERAYYKKIKKSMLIPHLERGKCSMVFRKEPVICVLRISVTIIMVVVERTYYYEKIKKHADLVLIPHIQCGKCSMVFREEPVIWVLINLFIGVTCWSMCLSISCTDGWFNVLPQMDGFKS